MSIPYIYNPLGSAGSGGDGSYITDGLFYHIDTNEYDNLEPEDLYDLVSHGSSKNTTTNIRNSSNIGIWCINISGSGYVGGFISDPNHFSYKNSTVEVCCFPSMTSTYNAIDVNPWNEYSKSCARHGSDGHKVGTSLKITGDLNETAIIYPSTWPVGADTDYLVKKITNPSSPLTVAFQYNSVPTISADGSISSASTYTPSTYGYMCFNMYDVVGISGTGPYLYAIRWYSRKLSAAELSHNAAVDKIRYRQKYLNALNG